MEYLNCLKSIPREAIVYSMSIVTLIWIINKLWKLCLLKRKKYNLQVLAVKTRNDRDTKIENFLRATETKISKTRIEQIIKLNMTTLAQMIKNRIISSQEAVLAYSIRAATIGKELCLITNINFEKAMEEAALADEKIAKMKIEDLPPLIGVPVSIKDHITVKNIPLTMGLTSLLKYTVNYDSLIIKNLQDKGAIPFVISNIPQGLLAIESSNQLWGSSKNPWNTNKTCGGSSGGEAGLVASWCSPFGIGSDYGGSIRLPSSFCGVYGFKPSASRISLDGIYTISKRQCFSDGLIKLSLGPICRTSDDIITVSQNLLGSFKDDPYCNNKPFDIEIITSPYDKKPKIGYLINLTIAETAPDIKNKLNSVINNLHQNGYETCAFEFENIDELLNTALSLMFNGGIFDELLEASQGEQLEKFNQNLQELKELSPFKIKLIRKLCILKGEHYIANLLNTFKIFSKDEFIENHKKLSELKIKFISYFKSQNFDALICPSFICPAFNIGSGGDFINFNKFLLIFNIMDMPCCTIPVGLCEDNTYLKRKNEHFDRIVEENMKTCLGLPVGIMIGTLPNNDEKCLRIMKDIDEFYRFDRTHGFKVIENLENSKIR